MGDVWAGVHRSDGVPVAIKVVSAKRSHHAGYLSAFRNEVRAVAGLDHPGIVLVYDHGAVDAAAAGASGGRLMHGSPYLAMERASRGSLAGDEADQAVTCWGELRALLLTLLDALAHAHARGVIHRDIKPANVLVCGPEDARPGPKLTDFGIAHAAESIEEGGGSGRVTGTPHYMAPEQLEGHARDMGPWTDLYALGCVAFELASGRRAFSGSTPIAVAFAHLKGHPASFVPRMPVPSGFVDWLRHLMAREPRLRFRCAADAAWALTELGDPPPERLRRGGPSGAHRAAPSSPLAAPTPTALTWGHLTATEPPGSLEQTAPTVVLDAARNRAVGRHEEPPRPVPPPPVPLAPEDWRRTGHGDSGGGPSVAHLTGAGLGLYGLRSVPVVGREVERDRLWEALLDVRRRARVRVVSLEGPAGCGKSRLARWLCERAHELGVATPLRAVHGPLGGPADGLEPMIARQLRTVGLDDHVQVLARVERLLRDLEVEDPFEWFGLAALVSPTSSDEAAAGIQPILFESPEERYVLVRRHLARLGRERPVVLWLDDVQWGLDALLFVRWLLDAVDREEMPVLVVATARDSALAERPAEAAVLSDLARHAAGERLRVEALGEAEHSSLVRSLLGLEPRLAARIVERTGGNPLFAVQLVGDWVERRLLAPGGEGFRLRSGAAPDLPDDLHEVWSTRIERLLAGAPEDHGWALEIAAVLGHEVEAEPWREACELAGLAVPEALVDAMLQAALAQAPREGARGSWSFVHGMLRESLARRAREGGRLAGHHRACAEMLARHPGGDAAGRRGRHLLRAGDHAGALEPLSTGAEWHIEREEPRAAELLLEDREQALQALALAEDDPRWGEQWVLRGQVEFRRRAYEESDHWAERADREGRRQGWPGVRGWALYQLASNAHERGKLERALTRAVAARAFAASVGDRKLQGLAGLKIGALLARRGDRLSAERRLEQALQALSEVQHKVGIGDCELELAFAARGAGDLHRAARLLRRARGHLAEAGSRRELAKCLNFQGEIARLRGELGEAEDFYRLSRDHYRAISSERTFVPMANLGLILLAQDRFGEARVMFSEALDLALHHRHLGLAGALHVALLVCLAGEGFFEPWDAHLAEALRLLRESDWVDPDIAPLAERAGDLALEAGEGTRAATVFGIAEQQWSRLGRKGRAAQVSKKRADAESDR